MQIQKVARQRDYTNWRMSQHADSCTQHAPMYIHRTCFFITPCRCTLYALSLFSGRVLWLFSIAMTTHLSSHGCSKSTRTLSALHSGQQQKVCLIVVVTTDHVPCGWPRVYWWHHPPTWDKEENLWVPWALGHKETGPPLEKTQQHSTID